MAAVKGTVKDKQRTLTWRLLTLHLCHSMCREGLLPFDYMVSAFVFVYLHTRDQAQSPTYICVIILMTHSLAWCGARQAHFLQLFFSFSCQVKTWTHGGSLQPGCLLYFRNVQRSWTGTPHSTVNSTAILVLTAPPALSTETYKGYLHYNSQQ